MKSIEKIQIKLIKDSNRFDDYLRLKNDPQSIVWSGFEEAPNQIRLKNYFENLIRSDKKLFFLELDNITVGYCQFSINDDGNYELVGYSILTEYANRGYGSIMIKTIIEILELHNQQSIIAWVSENNLSSIHCLEKSGFIMLKDTEKYIELKAFKRTDRFIAMYRPH